MDASINLVVKAPHQSTSDYKLECSEEWSVLQIKEHLSSDYPGKPSIESQRIIYSGRLLKDDMKIKDFVRKDPCTSTYILHLVSSTLSQCMFESKPQNVSNTSRNQDVPVSSAPNTNSIPNTMVYSPEVIAQQYALYQQLYTQYMAQYPNFMYQPQYSTYFAAAAAAASQTNDPQQPVQPPQNADADQNQPPADNRVNGAERVNDDDEEGGGNRDWFDWIYVLVRTLMTVGVLYSYSRVGRLFAVGLVTLLVYLYQNRWLAGPNQRADNVEPPREENNRPENVNENADGVERNEQPQPANEGNAPRENQEEPEPNAETPNEPNITYKLCRIALKLVLSLLPERPAVQNQ